MKTPVFLSDDKLQSKARVIATLAGTDLTVVITIWWFLQRRYNVCRGADKTDRTMGSPPPVWIAMELQLPQKIVAAVLEKMMEMKVANENGSVILDLMGLDEPEPKSDLTKFNKKSYMRDYMRRYRLAKRKNGESIKREPTCSKNRKRHFTNTSESLLTTSTISNGTSYQPDLFEVDQSAHQ